MKKVKKDTEHELIEKESASINSEEVLAEEEFPEPPMNLKFRVKIKNYCSYPVRVLLYMDEETGFGTYSVFRQFESRELDINLLTYRHLQRDPKVRMSKIDG